MGRAVTKLPEATRTLGARHRGVRHPHREQRLELDVRRTDRLLDRIEAGGVGDGHAPGAARRESPRLHAPCDPRPGAVDDHELDSQAAQQCEIVDDAVQPRIVDRFTVDLDDEGPPSVGVDVGRCAAEHSTKPTAPPAGLESFTAPSRTSGGLGDYRRRREHPGIVSRQGRTACARRFRLRLGKRIV